MVSAGPSASAGRGQCPARARELAARLAALFERDCEIVARLNDAQRRLRGASERLWSGGSPDAVGLVYDGAASAGQSAIGALVGSVDGGPEGRAAVLAALQQAHGTIHRAFHDYQWACEERRQLAVEVGEFSQQLTEVLCAVGWSADEARRADVHKLAGAL